MNDFRADKGRFLNYYGHRKPRLYRTQITGEEDPPSYLMQFIFLILFQGPSMHLSRIHELYMDQIIYTEGWRKLVNLLLKDWEDLVLWVCIPSIAGGTKLDVY